MFRSNKTRFFALSAAGLTAVAATTTGVALAAADNVSAPYVQAGATVNSAGSAENTKGVESTERARTGIYCVTFKDTNLDVTKAIPSATSLSTLHTVHVSRTNSNCPGANTLAVITRNFSGGLANAGFSVAIH
ncbi:hypothetical protein [Streptomyces boncukensis]|uniref:Secreted protein n=1 Tax=Streptomyces boncukensis TaxID=2711219 RepID=A0A6G4X5Q7_9ACTN|nr:hypothetical protein [Streptomyces boncukensis]NGO72187.1 hypothetical protein [Streptomyces boncukensis]